MNLDLEPYNKLGRRSGSITLILPHLIILLGIMNRLDAVTLTGSAEHNCCVKIRFDDVASRTLIHPKKCHVHLPDDIASRTLIQAKRCRSPSRELGSLYVYRLFSRKSTTESLVCF